jgi:hypothetical protein
MITVKHIQIISDSAVYMSLFYQKVEPLQPFTFSDEITPYGIIPMQYPTQGKMFSQWPDCLSKMVYR